MSPIEVVGVAASAVTVVGGVIGVVRHIRRRSTEDEARLIERPSLVRRLLQKRQPRDIEVVPLSFVISLNHPIPQVTVTLQAINYLGKTVELEHVTVGYFHVNMAPPIETVRGTEYELYPHTSRQVYCRRPLIDSEIRAFQQVPLACPLQATVHVSAKGKAGRRSVSYSNQSLAVNGWVEGRAALAGGGGGEA